MLHVFHLDAGRVLSYDVRYAAESVSMLQDAIFNSTGSNAHEQILLISGGEVLDPSKKVSNYSAGMDASNPIFLVCRGEPLSQSSKSVANFVESQATQELDAALKLHQQSSQTTPFQTIQSNVQLAQKFAAACDFDCQRCSQFVNDQHMIHQGWCAVIANLDDTTNAFRQRVARFRERHEKFLLQKSKAEDLLKNFYDDINLLKRIPLLNCLSTDTASGVASSSSSLFDWISNKEPESSLNDLADDTRKTLEQIMDSKIVENLTHWETVTLERTQDVQMKEIKGLGQRLHQINEYLELVKKIRAEQHQYIDMIVHQEQQALTTRDTSVLTQLYVSQTDVLKILAANQKRLTEIAKRFFEAKNELLKNIRVRLNWVTDTHQIIHTADNKVLLNGERLRKLRRQLELLRQLHDAPFVYSSAVSEVLRRKWFSREFFEWSERLVTKSRTLNEDENRLREIFAEKLDRHFLRSLFHGNRGKIASAFLRFDADFFDAGLDDKLPNFCTESPNSFDADLPSIELHHLREIRQCVPHLASLLQVCQPQIYEKMSMNEFNARTMSDAGALSRAQSFFSQTPPKYVQQATAAFNRSCQSPSWMSGDEFSPNTVGVLFHQQTTTNSNNNHNDSNATSGGEDVDSQESQVGDLPLNTTTPRSAPIRIPSRAPSDIMTSSRQFSEKSSRFGTPDEGTVDNGDSSPDPNVGGGGVDRLVSSPSLREITNMTQSMIGRVCQMNDEQQSAAAPLPLGHLSSAETVKSRSLSDRSLVQQKLAKLQRDLDEKVNLLNESIERERVLENRAKESEEKLRLIETLRHEKETLKNDVACTSACVKQLTTSFRQVFDDVRSSLTTFNSTTRSSTDKSTTTLMDAAKKLEINLQNNLAEAEKATSTVQEAEFQRRLDEMREELDKEKQKFRECQKQLENCEAYLKQKDDVIELLQQQLHDNEQQWVQRLEESKSEIIKQLTIEHELDLESLRREFQNQLDMKDNENRHVLNELRDKDHVIKQMRREQDKLVASLYERETNPGESGATVKDDDATSMDERLKQVKHDLEQTYKDKFQMLAAGLEQKHAQQIERLKVEKEVELRMLKENHKVELNRCRSELSSPVVETQSPMSVTTNFSSALVDDSCYAVVVDDQEAAKIMEPSTILQEEIDGSNKIETSVALKSPDIETNQENLIDYSPTKLTTTMGKNLSLVKFTQTRPDYRISVLRLQAGDLILLVYDQKIDSYVAFTVSTWLYVLKESSAQKNGLEKPKPPASSQETSKSSATTKWVFAKLLDSDFCQIKKPSNRYNLPLGTKFYRISAERCEIVWKDDVKKL